MVRAVGHDLHGIIDNGERWVRRRVDGVTRWVKQHPKTAAGIAAGIIGTFWALVIYNRGTLSKVGTRVVDAAKKQVFLNIIPARSRFYADTVLRVADDETVSPFLLVAIMERESRSGEALSPKGPSGTGDGGHGRGLMQIDDRSFGPDAQGVGKGDGWLASHDWRDPIANIRKGAQVYKGKRKYIQSKVPGLSDYQLMAASLAAYNSGEGTIVQSLKAGRNVDSTTAGGDYSSDVLKRIAAMEAAFNKVAGV